MKEEETQLFHTIKMQELGFRHNKPLLHSFLSPSKPNFIFRTYSMDSPLHFSSNFGFSYPSAPPSPSRFLFSHQSSPNFGFFSVPNSPGRRAFKSSPSPSDDVISATPDTTYGDKRSNVDEFDFEPIRRSYADEFQMSRHSNGEVRIDDEFGDDITFGTKETTYGDESCNGDEFEFETTRRFDGEEFVTNRRPNKEAKIGETKEYKTKCHRHHESLPAIAFADELFCQGKMMPLNPPPSQLHSSYSFNNTPSPVNPNAKFRIPFTRSLWNDDFDPFMVALETVKEEKREGHHHRRARSMLPLKACTTFDEVEEHKHCLHSRPLIASSPMRVAKPNGPEVESHGPGRSAIRLTEPKGVMFARRARMVKLGYNYEKPITKQGPEPIVLQVGEIQRRRNKWKKVLNFTKKRASEEKAEKDQSVEFAKSKLRKLSSKSNKMMQEKKEIQVATKMTLVRYRPKLLLCMGYGARFA